MNLNWIIPAEGSGRRFVIFKSRRPSWFTVFFVLNNMQTTENIINTESIEDIIRTNMTMYIGTMMMTMGII